MQPFNHNITPLGLTYNLLPLPLLPSLDPALQSLVHDAFQDAIDAGATEAQAVVKQVILHLRNQLHGPWLP